MNNTNRYGISFERKTEKCLEMFSTHHLYLQEDEGKVIVKNPERHQNLLIEGENYWGLKILQFTHKGKIDCIVIDPPYNSGNRDFVYNDTFVDSEDTFKHSKWLSFMDNRLRVAHTLLSDKGVIFISIDDNEMFQLKLLCDRIFGEENFIANLIWKNKFNGGYDAEFIATEHEYILVYARNKASSVFNKVPFNVEDDRGYKFVDEYQETRGKYKVMNLDDKSLKFSDSLKFPIHCQDGTEIWPNHCWRWGKEKVEWGFANGFLEIVKDSDEKWRINKKQYQYCDNEGNQIQRAYPMRSIIEGVANTLSGNEIKDLFGDKTIFSYAKPTALIKRLLFVATQKDSIVLDFFAGSGTTGQAVSELNKEDGGTRQFILITNNDTSDKLPNGICRDATYPRLQKTIDEENLKYYEIKALKKAEIDNPNSGDSVKIEQLELKGRLFGIYQLLYNTYNLKEQSDKHIIFTNHTGDFDLILYYLHWDKRLPFSKHFYQFQEKYAKQLNDNQAIILRGNGIRGYAADYYEAMKGGK